MLRREHNREHHLGGPGGVGGCRWHTVHLPGGGPGEGGFRVPRFKPRTAHPIFITEMKTRWHCVWKMNYNFHRWKVLCISSNNLRIAKNFLVNVAITPVIPLSPEMAKNPQKGANFMEIWGGDFVYLGL